MGDAEEHCHVGCQPGAPSARSRLSLENYTDVASHSAQLLKPLATLIGLRTLRISGLSSDSSMLPSPPPHNLHLTEVVLVDVK